LERGYWGFVSQPSKDGRGGAQRARRKVRGWERVSVLWRFTHLSDDETVAKMGHPVRWRSAHVSEARHGAPGSV
jgi:hypothetical protein